MKTKYEAVKDSIRKLITTGTYKVGEKLPTELSLMKRYNVSRYTIRRAMGELESEHYIYRIQGGGMFVENWRVNRQKNVTQKVIGIIATHLADYIFPDIISGMDRVLSGQGYNLLISNTHNDHKKERQSLQQMLNSNVTGLIMEPTQSARPNPNKDLYETIDNLSIPAMFINAHYGDSNLPFIDLADRQAEHDLINYLFDCGHQHILGVFKVDDLQGVHRMQGFQDAYTEHPAATLYSDVVMYQSLDDMSQLFDKIAHKLKDQERPTAIVCYNDELAIQLMDVIRSLDLKIPDDVSIVGFDDYLLSKYILPGLTTIAHPKKRMGIEAGEMLLKMIDGQKIESKIYHPQIVKRDSVKKLK